MTKNNYDKTADFVNAVDGFINDNNGFAANEIQKLKCSDNCNTAILFLKEQL